MYKESNTRSVIKTVSYRLLIVISNYLIALFLTHSFSLAAQVAGWSFAINTLIYFFHERFWNFVKWGKKKYKNLSPQEMRRTVV